MWRLALVYFLGMIAVSAQVSSGGQRIQQQHLADALAKVHAPGAENANALKQWVEVIEDARATQAIPDLEALEPKVTQSDVRLKIDAVLVRMHDSKPQYWQAVMAAAVQAAASAMPLPYTESNQLDPYFANKPWQSAAVQKEIGDAAIFYPNAIMYLGETADPRGDIVLRLALKSPNIFVLLSAAMGLAELDDESAVPVILAADQRLPLSFKGQLAYALVYFERPEAQAYVKRYLPKQENAETIRRIKPTPYSGADLSPMPQR